MDTQNAPQPVQSVQPQTPTPAPLQNSQPKKNPLSTILIGLVLVLLAIALGLGAYVASIYFTRKQTSILPPTNILPSTQPEMIVPSVTPDVNVPIAFPTSTKGSTFRSDKLGIAFYHMSIEDSTRNATVHTLETGSKVYIYSSYMKPETGQSIEMFEKPASEPLKTAIEKRFLTGISAADCFVETVVNEKSPKNIVKATISYPVPTDAEEPAFTFGDKCPANYRSSNGMAYFMEDTQYPDRFYYVSIGQYVIPAYDAMTTTKSQDEIVGWQDTLVILPIQK